MLAKSAKLQPAAAAGALSLALTLNPNPNPTPNPNRHRHRHRNRSPNANQARHLLVDGRVVAGREEVAVEELLREMMGRSTGDLGEI